jgi:DNA-binding beta-propeller fold protein YncE
MMLTILSCFLHPTIDVQATVNPVNNSFRIGNGTNYGTDVRQTNPNLASDVSTPSLTNIVEPVPAVKLDTGITGITYNQYDGNMYVTNINTNTTYAIDPSKNAVVKNITVPRPDGIFYEPFSSRLYVISSLLDTIYIVDPQDLEPNESNITGFNFSYPVGIAYDPVERSIYIANSISDTVYRLGVFSSYFEANITGFHHPRGITYSPANGKIYVANSWNTASVIGPDVKSIIKNVEISPGYNQLIAYNPSNGKIYVTSGSSLDIIDPLKEMRIKTIPLASSSTGLAYNPSNGKIYVLSSSNTHPKISIIDSYADTIISEIRLPSKVNETLQGIEYNPSNSKMYVVTYEGSMYVI